MNGARRSDGALPLELTTRLVAFIRSRPHKTSIGSAVVDFAALSGAERFRIWNTLAALKDYALFDDAGEHVRVSDDAALDVANALGQRVAKHLAGFLEAGYGLQSLAIDGGELLLDARLLPGKDLGLPFFVIEFGVASRELPTSRYWRVAKRFVDLIKTSAKSGNRIQTRRKMSLAALKRRLDENAEDGAAAEDWVVRYERRRMATHPFVEEIRRISDEDVAAGFDIVSFANNASLEQDRFIEVKSYVGRKRFFWSANEVAAAQELGEQYCLYIVDRDRMADNDYIPHIIPGPYVALMLASGHGWQIDPAAFKCAEVEIAISLDAVPTPLDS